MLEEGGSPGWVAGDPQAQIDRDACAKLNKLTADLALDRVMSQDVFH